MPMWGKRQKSYITTVSALGLALAFASVSTPAYAPQAVPTLAVADHNPQAALDPTAFEIPGAANPEIPNIAQAGFETSVNINPSVTDETPQLPKPKPEISSPDSGLIANDIHPVNIPALAGAPAIPDSISGKVKSEPKTGNTNRRSSEKYAKLASIERTIPRSAIPDITPAKPKTSGPMLEKRSVGGTVEIRFDDERRISQWSKVYDRFQADSRMLSHCVNYSGTCSDPILADWAAKLRPLKSMPKRAQIQQVNNLVNELGYQRDRNNYGQSDYWASPKEFLTRRGDCEDFAILKYASLIALGHSEQNMRISVGKITGMGSHAFLLVGDGRNELTLDNRTNIMTLAAERYDFIPAHSMNTTYRWAHLKPQGRAT